MKYTIVKWSLFSFFMLQATAALITPSVAEDSRARYKGDELNDSGSTVSRASEVYKAIVKEGKVPPSVLTNAKCIAVFPSVVTAAVGIGGIHGDGVSFCRNASGTGWSNPVFLNLTGASLGLQVGVKSADLVLYMTTDKAKDAIQNGEFSLTGELSAVAGSLDETYTAPRSGVIAYTRTGGAFAGASIAGIQLSHDKDEQKAFYGSYDKSSIFEGKMPPNVSRSVSELQGLLPA